MSEFPLSPAIERRAGAMVLAVAAVAAIILFRTWLESRDDHVRMAATMASQGTLIAAAERREQDRAHELADTLKQIADLKRSVQTPQQVIREIPQYLPPLPKPLEALPPETPVAATGKGATTGAGEVADMRVPAEDLKALFDFTQDCRACQAKLSAAQNDVQDERAKNDALQKERDAAVKAAKGGGFWLRTKRAVRWLAVGFAVGYVAHAASH
jgi:septal ring factor EnvC (AmiA/AmiB activator)